MTDDRKFRSEQTKRAIMAMIEVNYRLTDERKELIKQEIGLLVDDLADCPINYMD